MPAGLKSLQVINEQLFTLREMERPPVPENHINGPAGSKSKNVIPVSGGARKREK
ncbi:hypothetical protein [Nitrosomonas supralitoralis]|uniref:hypothetical protein n=1 Tax=Nitrosomonas supralitoralis TaxID=2116706 RepID=UPI001558AE88|nr:hypothetical protein [Nitrosomonas supralitoralis]